MPPIKIAHVVNISGGKDSTACGLLALDATREDRRAGHKVIFVFADTGHESKETYDYLDYLGGRLNAEILRVKREDLAARFYKRKKFIAKKWKKDGIAREIRLRAVQNLKPTGNPMLDLCLLKGSFPSRIGKWCTQELKIAPVKEQVITPLLNEGYHIVQWLGIRADESRKRKDTRLFRKDTELEKVYLYHPIREWTEKQVFAFLKKRGVMRNPMYDAGCSRVGCAPCIFSSKNEMAVLAKNYPEDIERVRIMEAMVEAVSKRGRTSLFKAKNKYFKERLKATDKPMSIDDVVAWATETAPELVWGQGDMFADDHEELREILEHDECNERGWCG